MNILMLVIRYDVDDWATNFIPRWVAKLASHVDALNVLALEVGNVGTLPDNVRVYSMGKERGRGRFAVLAGFYHHALPLIVRCDAVLVHMIPRYALLAAPIALPLRKSIMLWYTHRNPSRDLMRAIPLVRRVVTAVESSFPIKTDKLRVLGHGIDASFYPQASVMPEAKNYIVHVARLQSIKQQDVLIHAMTHLPDAHAVIIGDVPQGEDQTYPQQLRQLVHDLGLQGRVTFTGGLSAEAVREWYQRATLAVNLSPPGLFDKAALESMVCGVPTLVTNPAFDGLLGDWCDHLRVDHPLNSESLAQKLQALLDLSTDQRTAMAQMLRQHVQQQHSLDALIPRLVAVLETGEINAPPDDEQLHER